MGGALHLTFRALLNVVYDMATEPMDAKERSAFDRDLVAGSGAEAVDAETRRAMIIAHAAATGADLVIL